MELRIDKVTKEFKDLKAVKDVDLNFTSGIWGLLGPNGAGKQR
jgi:ABC-2 type transport system ATP-binding protein